MLPALSRENWAILSGLPKAELHLHFEGTINPHFTVQLAEHHGEFLEYEQVARRYNFRRFTKFLDLFKFVTSFLRVPADYALVAQRLPLYFGNDIRYAEITLSVGVMLLRGQDVEQNLASILSSLEGSNRGRVQVRWVFDAVRQFGPDAAMKVAKLAVKFQSSGIVAFGLGGDELSMPLQKFRRVYDYVAEHGLHRVVHAGEMGDPEQIRTAIYTLGAERIGHGIAAIRDSALMELLSENRIPLEVCPSSNVRTGALAKQIGKRSVTIADHPLPDLFRRGVPITLASDDPAMFHTHLLREYAIAATLGLRISEIKAIARAGWEFAFLQPVEKARALKEFDARSKELGLI